ncbi:MAG: DegV family protein [Culicoidibacterales bacterium]
MNKKPLAVLVDSTGADIKLLDAHQDIYLQPLSITFGTETFSDITELKPEQFYEMLKANANHPITSQPVIGEVVNHLTELLESYENVLCISLSSKLSGTYSGFVQAAEMVNSEHIRVIDTEHTGPLEWILAEHAIALAQSGTDFLTIVDTIQNHIQHSRLYVYIDTLTYLAKSGRLSGAKALVGNLIQMKTNLVFREGKPEVIDRIRTAKKAIFQLVDSALDELTEQTQTLYIGYADSTRPAFVDDIQAYILNKFPNLHIRETIIPAVLGNNSGPGGYGITYVNGL